MTTLFVILVLVAAVAIIGFAFAAIVKNDGYGRPSPKQGTPPRSHTPDAFDPRVPTRFA